MRSRTFLHVSLGILALAAAYHLSGGAVVAQGTGTSIAAAEDGWVFAQNGDVYQVSDSQWTLLTNVFATAGRPASGPLVAAMSRYVFTADGDAYVNTIGREWAYAGNVFEGDTPVQSESWGSVKARYRGERTPARTDR